MYTFFCGNSSLAVGIHTRVSVVQVIRGTAPLPRDLEQTFRRIHGRDMNPEERKFFGLERPNPKPSHSADRDSSSEAA
jgi:hypothetical protein